ncbi:MAG TPA: DedA family protein [Longimicrobiales bacterium]|nr:DedA family protein [Longimicrobiales bacterium]
MDLITPRLAELITAHGPWLLFGMAVLETSFVTGLVVPSGLATALATVLALNGEMDLRPLLAAALVGAAVGDTLGFWVGRAAGDRVFMANARWSGLLRRRHRELGVTLGRHPFFSVTLARLVSFVRTLMPMAAGMSDMSFRKFLVYDIPGVLAWVCLYVGVGYLAEESWHMATRILGLGGALALAGAAVFLWWSVFRRVGRRSGVTGGGSR